MTRWAHTISRNFYLSGPLLTFTTDLLLKCGFCGSPGGGGKISVGSRFPRALKFSHLPDVLQGLSLFLSRFWYMLSRPSLGTKDALVVCLVRARTQAGLKILRITRRTRDASLSKSVTQTRNHSQQNGSSEVVEERRSNVSKQSSQLQGSIDCGHESSNFTSPGARILFL